jgi:hypothetical protein
LVRQLVATRLVNLRLCPFVRNVVDVLVKPSSVKKPRPMFGRGFFVCAVLMSSVEGSGGIIHRQRSTLD